MQMSKATENDTIRQLSLLNHTSFVSMLCFFFSCNETRLFSKSLNWQKEQLISILSWHLLLWVFRLYEFVAWWLHSSQKYRIPSCTFSLWNFSILFVLVFVSHWSQLYSAALCLLSKCITSMLFLGHTYSQWGHWMRFPVCLRLWICRHENHFEE